jgi:Ni,Fe-hydrogenase III large subunit
MQGTWVRTAMAFVAGGFCGLVAAMCFSSQSRSTAAYAGAGSSAPSEQQVEALRAEIESIKEKLPDQAHAMHDVDYHFTNLWFAAAKEHWTLANFYLGETRSHLRWAVRIIPKRKDNAGQEIDLAAILQAFENTPLKQLEDAVNNKDRQAFEKSYAIAIETCYACHKAADKPYLRPRIPQQPETHIINFNPAADWPK